MLILACVNVLTALLCLGIMPSDDRYMLEAKKMQDGFRFLESRPPAYAGILILIRATSFVSVLLIMLRKRSKVVLVIPAVQTIY